MTIANIWKTGLLGLAALVLAACAATPTQESTGEYVDDTVITTKVKAALVESDVVDATDVSVETFKGRVQLSGFVDSENERSAAVAAARQVPGVKSVEDKLSLKGS